MKPIAFLLNGVLLLCTGCGRNRGGSMTPVLGNTVERSCNYCGYEIPANRKHGEIFKPRN